jgi:hypothetical protein
MINSNLAWLASRRRFLQQVAFAGGAALLAPGAFAEQLSNGEAAVVLGIQERAAAKRYVRALKRLKDLLAQTPGGLSGLRP